MTLLEFLNPRTPITTRAQATHAAQGAAAVWGFVAVLFGFGVLATIGNELVIPGKLPQWFVQLGIVLAALGMAFLTNRFKTLALAVVAACVAAVMSAMALLGLLVGEGAFLVFALFAIPYSIQGVRGARALRKLAA